jgi:hypothetical protein
MKRAIAIVCLLSLLLARAAPVAAARDDEAPPTTRSRVLTAVYFPFLVLGHGLMLIGKYGIGYPLYYTFKPVYDLLYESSEDPAGYSSGDASGS